MKTHIVREPFSLNGVDYPKGAEITDHDVIAQVRVSHSGHVVQQHHDAVPPAPTKQAEKPAPAAAQ